ncbi:MAG: AraC family transcriptional regulator, transcriptional activator FtrA [Actinomycetota bacterium]|nr:AraC family transcriptional regulator, transcriptional activator FtrA [Actinomycetota bacterium]
MSVAVGVHPVPVRPSVSVLAFDGMSPFETGVVVEVFGLPRPELGVEWYDLAVCAPTAGPLRVVGGFTMTAEHGLDVFAAAQTVIVPGVADVHGAIAPEVVAALRAAHRAGSRIVSICSGAFALAAAGLLDGRRATTHWRYAELLQSRYPAVMVDADVLYVDDGDVLTSAGSAAGLDLCLHLVRKDFGPSVANMVARRLVVAPHRAGGQAQFIEAAVPPAPDDDRVARSMVWALENIAQPITVESLARQAQMAKRTYTRHFQRSQGTSPLRWFITQRVQASLLLLESSDAGIEQIARSVGFENATTYRQHFQRAMRTSPSGYRRSFRSAAGIDATLND